MVAVQMSGGLGNQMFEYALYLKLKSMGKEVKVDDFTCYGPGERQKMLDIFGIRYERLTREEYIKLTDSNLKLSHRIRRKLTGRKSLAYREASSDFDPEILTREPALFEGYFQTEKYFADIADTVREAFVFRNLKKDAQLCAYEQQIKNCQAVSLHIRRGDYLDPKYSALYKDICTPAYYEKAEAYIQNRYPDAVFFVFSNDLAWAKQHYQGQQYVVVEGADENSGYRDLYLMSLCKHHIMANSSFSWWGAWLNPNPQKCVVAPDRWLNGRECRDIYSDWMTVL